VEPNDVKELGRISVAVKYKASSIEAKIQDDNIGIENVYYDPFETDQVVVKEVNLCVGCSRKNKKFTASQFINRQKC
jgi:hypothetical protein